MFITTSSDDLWRSVPPEEKLELMARAHSKGTLSCMITLVVAGTISVALQLEWLLWAGFIAIPFVFQFAAGKAWRAFRPRVMLEYLAARAAARRYAYVVRAEQLHLNFLFRGHIEHLFEDDQENMEALEAAVQNTKEASVWVALFGDAVVMMTEKYGGAQLEFGALINDRFRLIPENDDSRGGYDRNRSIVLEYEDKYTGMHRVRLRSPYAAALVVFEKRTLKRVEEYIASMTLLAESEANAEAQ